MVTKKINVKPPKSTASLNGQNLLYEILKGILWKSETSSYDHLPKTTTFQVIEEIPLYIKTLKATTSLNGHNELNVKLPNVTTSLNGHNLRIELIKNN